MIATSGGATIMAADKAELHAVALPQPGPGAAAVLAARIPEFGSPRNPCDVTAQVITDSGSLLACVDALLEDPAFGALVTSHAYAYSSATARLGVFQRQCRGQRQDRLQRMGAGMAGRTRRVRKRG